MVTPPQNQWARDYDAESKRYEWHGPEILFGLAFEFVTAGETLLDLGIGTGLSSFPFRKAGLEVFGIDASAEILEVCRTKNIARELRQHDILQPPLPYPDGGFDNVIACGVFHLIDRLEPILSEASRLLKENGAFAFTFEKHRVGADDGFPVRAGEVSKRIDEESGAEIFRHSESYVKRLLGENGLVVLKTAEFVATVHPDTGRKVHYRAVVTRKIIAARPDGRPEG
ncbi:MAG: methyltransferase family protein [Candidatus Krumholzibacteriota bacterium]|nr:methyltransferase family protein [Candidatus Krumholzibacteriota bacterium]